MNSIDKGVDNMEESVKKKDRRTIYTENVIKDALLDLIQEKSIDKITVTEICRVAEINRGTFYLHYTDCNDVLKQLEEELCDKIIQFIDEDEYSNYDDVIKQLRKVKDLLSKDKKAQILFTHMENLDQVFAKLLTYTKNQMIKSWRQKSELSQEQAEWIATFIIYGNVALENQYNYLSGERDDIERIIKGVIMEGLHKYIKG